MIILNKTRFSARIIGNLKYNIRSFKELQIIVKLFQLILLLTRASKFDTLLKYLK